MKGFRQHRIPLPRGDWPQRATVNVGRTIAGDRPPRYGKGRVFGAIQRQARALLKNHIHKIIPNPENLVNLVNLVNPDSDNETRGGQAPALRLMKGFHRDTEAGTRTTEHSQPQNPLILEILKILKILLQA